MKVNGDYQAGLEKLKGEHLQKTQGGARLGIMVAQHGEKLHGEQITRLLGDIPTAGDRIAWSRNIQDMARFKMLLNQV